MYDLYLFWAFNFLYHVGIMTKKVFFLHNSHFWKLYIYTDKIDKITVHTVQQNCFNHCPQIFVWSVILWENCMKMLESVSCLVSKCALRKYYFIFQSPVWLNIASTCHFFYRQHVVKVHLFDESRIVRKLMLRSRLVFIKVGVTF